MIDAILERKDVNGNPDVVTVADLKALVDWIDDTFALIALPAAMPPPQPSEATEPAKKKRGAK